MRGMLPVVSLVIQTYNMFRHIIHICYEAEQPVSMSTIKRLLKMPRVRVALGIAIIAIAVLAVLLSPYREPDDPNIGLINDPNPPTVVVTHPIAALNVNRGLYYQQMTLTITNVQEAGAFSDDAKTTGGTYTVRVNVHVQPESALKSPLAVNYAALVRLMLPDGQIIASKLINLQPVVFPGKAQDGYFDFGINTQVALASLSFKLSGAPTIAFGS